MKKKSTKILDADLEAEKLKCKTQNQNSKIKTTDFFQAGLQD